MPEDEQDHENGGEEDHKLVYRMRRRMKMVHLPCTSLTALSKVNKGLMAMLFCHVWKQPFML